MIEFIAFDKSRRMAELWRSVQRCSLCPRLNCRNKVLSNLNGDINSNVMFIAEAPGRLGADRTMIPLFGDKTGDNFDKLLGNIGWDRDNVFITNALLCNPRDEAGNNSTPTSEELYNCSVYLEMTIDIVNPKVIVTLGKTALDALKLISPHNYELKESVGRPLSWNNRIIVPLYHPGPRAMVHRAFPKQTADFIRLDKIVKKINLLTHIKRDTSKSRYISLIALDRPKPLHQVVFSLLDYLHEISYFKLTKLIFLIDYHAIQKFGFSITGETYLRMQDGPWPPRLPQTIKEMYGREIIQYSKGGTLYIKKGPSPRFKPSFLERELDVIWEVLTRYKDFDNFEIKSAAYRTIPMRYILKEEAKGTKTANMVVMQKDNYLGRRV